MIHTCSVFSNQH